MGQLHAFLRLSGGLEGPAMPVAEPPAQLFTQLRGRVLWPGRVDVGRGPSGDASPSPRWELSPQENLQLSGVEKSQLNLWMSRAQESAQQGPQVLGISLQASRGMTHQGRDSPKHSG